MAGDQLGGLNITYKGVIKRDEIVFQKCIQSGVPLMMVLSGGYQKINGALIGESLLNLHDKFNILG